MNWPSNERDIFLAALERPDEQARREYLDQVCAEDIVLRKKVEDLLRAAANAGDFLEQPPPGMALAIRADHTEAWGESLRDLSLDFLIPSDKPGCLGCLGQYEVVGLVGRGGFGLVLRAFDTKLNRVVAIKVMVREVASHPMAVKRFLREAQAAAAVSHDHVITIHAVEETHAPPYLVMECLQFLSARWCG